MLSHARSDFEASIHTGVHLIDTTPSKSNQFLKNLKKGFNLSPFFIDNWTFLFHEDNRCDGSTDGQLHDLKKTAIDSTINLKVVNDGDGWACDKKEPRTYHMDFNLKKKITLWDRFEIHHFSNDNKKKVYLLGAGESDYIILHFNSDDLIFLFEYRSEDPG
ncbi:hypothetical protein [Crocinitomix algicola]|uniref:hypothetical protein n=1 Tax=Crocinitomix algicola TaxID=1740263 RepID=UPI000872DB44|nr:hypothetical protein [Crocinitomix algicola]